MQMCTYMVAMDTATAECVRHAAECIRHCTLMLSAHIRLCTNYYRADCVWIAWVWATFWAITCNFWFGQSRDMYECIFHNMRLPQKNMQCLPVGCHIYCVVFKSMLGSYNLFMDLILAIVLAWQQNCCNYIGLLNRNIYLCKKIWCFP